MNESFSEEGYSQIRVSTYILYELDVGIIPPYHFYVIYSPLPW